MIADREPFSFKLAYWVQIFAFPFNFVFGGYGVIQKHCINTQQNNNVLDRSIKNLTS